MKALDLLITVDDALGPGRSCRIAATIHLPDLYQTTRPQAILFAFPGGGYTRSYFDLRIAGHDGYSEAEHHTQHGIIVVACDHLGVGESTGEGPESFPLEVIAAANAGAVVEIVRRLESGSLAHGLPPIVGATRVGEGQSMGGSILLLMQSRHRCFDAIVMLGSSAIENALPQPTAELTAAARRFFGALGAASWGATTDSVVPPAVNMSYAFHWEDVPASIVAADVGSGYPDRRIVPPWGSATVPRRALEVMVRGRFTDAAASVVVPVLIALGERDILLQPLVEASAYPRSSDVSIFIAPTMAHMHNFAGTRHQLWARISWWVRRMEAVRLSALR